MTRKSRRGIERVLDDLERTVGTDTDLPSALSGTDKEQFNEVVRDAVEELSDEERSRLGDLLDQIEAEDTADENGLSATEEEVYALLFHA